MKGSFTELLKFEAFLNWWQFELTLWQNSEHFDTHSKIRGILIFVTFVMFMAKFAA